MLTVFFNMVSKNEICVIIPIYEENLTDYEIQSVQQCINILNNYKIIFITYKNLDLDFYKLKFPSIVDFVFFDEIYFKGLKGYNRLMVSSFFYKEFSQYKYMLIYQTDCYVFKDKLLEWANKGYDYIGGIWYEGFHGNPDFGAKFWCACNGGMSLRNINAIIQVLTSKKRLKTYRQLLEEKKIKRNDQIIKTIKKLTLFFFQCFRCKNNAHFYAETFSNNEDVFFAEMYLKYNLIKIPKVEDALLFAWDRRPDFLFDNLGELPFGCHAWFRTDVPYEGNKVFWLKIINEIK